LLTITRWLLLAMATTLVLGGARDALADDVTPAAPVVPAVASIVASGATAQEAPVSTGFGAPLQVLVRDAYGQPVKGASVTFSLGTGSTGAGASFLAGGGQASALSDASGLATSPPFVANASPGRFLASASTADIPAVLAFTLVNHASATRIVPARASVQRARAGTRFPQRLQVRVLGADLRPIEGAAVTFTLPQASSGAGASFTGGGSQATAVTDADGRASSPQLLASSAAGRFTATASTPVVATAASFRLRIVAGPPTSITAGAASGQIATIASSFRIPLAVTVHDADANPVAGAVVAFAAPSAGASGRFGSPERRIVRVRTNSDGIAVAPSLTANRVSGGYVLIARVAGTPLRTAFALVNERAS
jgi:hypothetical protein